MKRGKNREKQQKIERQKNWGLIATQMVTGNIVFSQCEKCEKSQLLSKPNLVGKFWWYFLLNLMHKHKKILFK